MYTTIDYLETKTHQKRLKHKILHFFNEIKTLVIIFLFVSMGMIVFTNAKLFISNVKQDISIETVVSQAPLTSNQIYQDNSIASVIDQADSKNKELDSIINQYKQSGIQSVSISTDSESLLEQNTKDYDFKFNMLPPTNRLMVPSLGVDDPIVISKYMDIKDFTNGNFDKELENGPVKYPTTPDPGVNGNTLIFGHTSQERRKKNPFGMTFAHIADLNLGDIIQVVRNGTLHEYKIINIVAVYPERVPEEYNKYTNLGKSYLTLMGCYPIGTATKRMLVTAEEQVKSQ